MTEAMPPDWAKWKVGMKVVCIKPFNKCVGRSDTPYFPITGQIYTIRTIASGIAAGKDGGSYARFVELPNPIHDYGHIIEEPHFILSSFRPLQDKPDAIEWARQICRDVEKSKRRESVA